MEEGWSGAPGSAPPRSRLGAAAPPRRSPQLPAASPAPRPRHHGWRGSAREGRAGRRKKKKKSKIKPEETAAKCGRGRGATRGGGAGPLPRPGAALPPRPGNPRLLVRDRADKIPCSPLRNALSKADAIFCVADVDIDKRRHISPPSCFSPFTQTCDREAAGSGKRARGERRHGHK